jgi:hypothetical protein
VFINQDNSEDVSSTATGSPNKRNSLPDLPQNIVSRQNSQKGGGLHVSKKQSSLSEQYQNIAAQASMFAKTSFDARFSGGASISGQYEVSEM